MFQYDAAGRVVVDTTQDAAGRVRSESHYAYDDQVRRTEWRLLGGRGELLGRSAYRYDGGEVAEVQNFDGAGALQETVAYSRDGDGRLRSELVRDAGGTELTRDDRSYAGDVLQSVAYFSAGVLVGSERFEYDAEGFITRTSSHGADDALKSYVVVDYAPAGQLVSP